MKKLINSIYAITILAFAITSCDKNGDPVIPDPTPSDHDVLWSYDMGVGSLEDITPALDDNDNSYYSIYDMETSKTIAFALNKDGGELWKQEFDGSSLGKVIYADNRVFVSTNDPTAVHCVNATSGNVEWSKNLSEEYDFIWSPTTAYNNGKLYISSGQMIAGYLMAFDIEGNELWLQQTGLDGSTFNLSVVGDALYFHDGYSLYRYNDNGATCDFVWDYNFSANKSTKLTLALYDLPIGEDGNIYVRDENIYVISPDGQLVSTITLDESFNQMMNSNITLTSNNQILIGNGNLVEMSNTGNIEWETNISGMIVNPTFTSAATLAQNGDFYDAQMFGLFCVNSNGSLNWSVTSENGGGIEHGNLHPPVLTHEGNIISVSSEQKFVRCFKGDGSGLASGGWPKPFGDYGNTSSK